MRQHCTCADQETRRELNDELLKGMAPGRLGKVRYGDGANHQGRVRTSGMTLRSRRSSSGCSVQTPSRHVGSPEGKGVLNALNSHQQRTIAASLTILSYSKMSFDTTAGFGAGSIGSSAQESDKKNAGPRPRPVAQHTLLSERYQGFGVNH